MVVLVHNPSMNQTNKAWRQKLTITYGPRPKRFSKDATIILLKDLSLEASKLNLVFKIPLVSF